MNVVVLISSRLKENIYSSKPNLSTGGDLSEDRWLIYFRIGLIVAIAGALMGLVTHIRALEGLGRVIGITSRIPPTMVEFNAWSMVYPYLLLAILLDIVVLLLSVGIYKKWSEIEDSSNVERVYLLLIILIVATVISLNIVSLIGAVIAIYGLMSKFPRIGIGSGPLQAPSSHTSPKLTVFYTSMKEVYDRLFDRYQETYGSGMARKMLENRIRKLMERGLSQEEALKTLYEKTFFRKVEFSNSRRLKHMNPS